MNIKVTRRGKKVVADFAEKYGMKEVNVASRLYEWFSRQPEPVQKWVAGLANGNEGTGMAMFAQQIFSALNISAEHGQKRVRRKDRPLAFEVEPPPKPPGPSRQQ